MPRWLRITLNWLATAVTWVLAPVGGGAAAIFLSGGFLWVVGALVGTATGVPSPLFYQFGAIGALWCAAVWFVFFLHNGFWSRSIHFVGCTLGALVSLPFLGLFLMAAG